LSGRDFRGLLLLPTDNKKGEYTRAGRFELWAVDERTPENLERFLKLLEQSGKATAEAHYTEILKEPKFTNEPYVITII
jgi:hypothetical protein